MNKNRLSVLLFIALLSTELHSQNIYPPPPSGDSNTGTAIALGFIGAVVGLGVGGIIGASIAARKCDGVSAFSDQTDELKECRKANYNGPQNLDSRYKCINQVLECAWVKKFTAPILSLRLLLKR